MQNYTEFVIFTNDKKTKDTEPTHTLNVKIGEQYVQVAGLWAKTSSKGTRFLSGKMKSKWSKDGKSGNGYFIGVDKQEIPQADTSDFDEFFKEKKEDDVDLNSIPF